MLHYEGSKSSDVLYSAGWFVFGITLTASGWFSVTTSSEGLRELVPPDAALYAAIGLQAGVLSSAYFLARLTRRRVYWLAFYLLTAALLVSFSDIGMRKVLGAGGARPRISQSADQAEPMIARLLTLRHPSPAEVVSLAIAGAFALIPLLGLPIILGKRRFWKLHPGGPVSQVTFHNLHHIGHNPEDWVCQDMRLV